MSNKPHKHAALIKQWADGAEIEFRTFASDGWESLRSPGWVEHIDYRIKPEPKPDDVLYAAAWYNETHGLYSISGSLTVKKNSDDNLKLTFDGETNKLIKAEVI